VVEVKLNCPNGTWPGRFTGSVALGITEARPTLPSSLWIFMEVVEGNLQSAAAGLSDGATLPEGSPTPIIFAHAPRAVWEVISSDTPDQFHSLIEDGGVKVGGDFRLFARHAHSLLRTVEEANVWTELDDIIAAVVMGSSDK
jgi:hypothetical protein